MNEHNRKLPEEISDIVLAQQFELKKRKELYQSVHKMEYDGDI